jgi:hypothetical protein
MTTWRNKLNKTELHHLKMSHIVTLTDFKETRTAQKELDRTKEVCYECRHIAIKLGLEA